MSYIKLVKQTLYLKEQIKREKYVQSLGTFGLNLSDLQSRRATYMPTLKTLQTSVE